MLRIAQTETGGKRLIQAGFLKTLGSCDFISRQPYLEDMDCMSSYSRVIVGGANSICLLDTDTALPMPAERYHQVLLPVLRVAAAVAQSLDSETAKVSCCHHRAAFRLSLPVRWMRSCLSCGATPVRSHWQQLRKQQCWSLFCIRS